jgi:hypothetical protein
LAVDPEERLISVQFEHTDQAAATQRCCGIVFRPGVAAGERGFLLRQIVPTVTLTVTEGLLRLKDARFRALMAAIDDELGQIEKDIRRLKIEYEQFFGGGRARPPADTQWRLETMMKRYGDRGADMNFAQRFRFNNLSQTYAKYVDMWRKKTQQKEGAVSQHHFGAAAKAIEAERAQAERTAGGSSVAVAAGSPLTRPLNAPAFALSFSDPDQEKAKIVKLYQRVVQAHQESGEAAGAPNLQAFERFVRKKTQELKDKGGKEVEYSVTIQDGKVKLKARISG